MPLWLPAIPYPPPREHGYWHPITSTLNWCEEDYYATYYVAEFINTFTNLLFLCLAVRGIRNCLRYGHDRIFLIGFIGYGFVGGGSLLFHATLKYSTQLLDELSMIYTACFMAYATFCHFRNGKFHPTLAIALVLLATFITLYYHYLQNPVFHQNAYALITAIILLRSMWIMEKYLRPMIKEEAPGETPSMRHILAEMWVMIAFGLTTFLSGFGIWILDRKFCSQLIQWRREIGLPWGVLLEGHGWWHLLTGIGAYFYIVWITWLRYCLKYKHKQFRLNWPSMFFSVPDVVAVPPRSVEASDRKVRKPKEDRKRK